ncbi:MAG: hypothetical protein GX982_06545 [Tissierellia bacterium]|nr:hypothetical protein [Tissierellia bacterium]
MLYINALELVYESINAGILKEEDNKVYVYRENAGWCLEDKDIVAKEIMNNKKAQNIIISALKKAGRDFTPTDYSSF